MLSELIFSSSIFDAWYWSIHRQAFKVSCRVHQHSPVRSSLCKIKQTPAFLFHTAHKIIIWQIQCCRWRVCHSSRAAEENLSLGCLITRATSSRLLGAKGAQINEEITSGRLKDHVIVMFCSWRMIVNHHNRQDESVSGCRTSHPKYTPEYSF